MCGNLSKRLSALAVIALVATTASVHSQMRAPALTEQDESFVPRQELLRTASLGFTALISDYYWLEAVQLVGAAKREE